MADETALPAPPPPSPEGGPPEAVAKPAEKKDELAKEPHPGGTQRGPGEGMSRQAKNPMAFLVLVVVLCIAGWFIVNWMSDTTKIQDCVMAGRKNCTEMDPSLGR